MCIVSVLSVFDIVKARDKDGKEIEAKIEISPEFVTCVFSYLFSRVVYCALNRSNYIDTLCHLNVL
jgi:hypothetical protein